MRQHSNYFWREAKERGVVVRIQTDYSQLLLKIKGYNSQIVWGITTDSNVLLLNLQYLQYAKFENSKFTNLNQESVERSKLFWQEVLETKKEIVVKTTSSIYHMTVSGYNTHAIWGTTREGEDMLLNVQKIVSATYALD